MRIGLGVGSDVKIDHGAGQRFVAENLLDVTDGHIGFDEMSGVGMAKYMWMNVLGDSKAGDGALEDALDTALADMTGSLAGVLAVIVTQGRKDPFGIAMGLVVDPKHFESDLRQGNHAIHGPLYLNGGGPIGDR
jgi:hypothetical protein